MEVREAIERYGTDRPDLRTSQGEVSMLVLVNFPLGARTAEGRIELTRHPMALPRRMPDSPEHMLDIDTWTFDLVLNGIELASGGLRISNAALQRQVLTLAGIDPASFEDLLHVLEGSPPHGGLGMGLDRLCMQLLGAESIAEVTTFPARFGYWSRSENATVS
jgi:aspartyl-tRNA synthetase